MKTDRKYAFETEKFLYCVEEGEKLVDIEEKFDVPMHKLISDNMLEDEVKEGQMLYIDVGGGKTETVLPDGIKKVTDVIKKRNGIEYVYPFQKIFV